MDHPEAKRRAVNKITAQFQRRLSQRVRQERAWHTLLVLLRVGPPLLAVAALLLLLDLLLALPGSARAILGSVALVGLALRFGGSVWQALRSPAATVARAADDAGDDRRRSILSAWELLQSGLADGDEGLSAALANRAAERGHQRLASAPSVRAHRARALRRKGAGALLAVLASGLALWQGQPAADILLRRLVTPWQDIPPWSRLHFRVSPDPARVPFGGELTLAVTVSGAEVKAPVEIETRAAGTTQRSTCFAEGEGRYAIRLENVVEPLEFCFRSGRARTTWQRLELRMQPRILGASVAVQPPAYSGLEARRFALGQAPVKALKGSRLTLRLICNRAVPTGTLKLTDAATGKLVTVQGQAQPDGSMRFQWQVAGAGFGVASVTSADDLSCRTPVEFRQLLVEDAPPRAVIHEPGLFALATPTSRVPIRAVAEDDLGLDRVTLVRTVAGFRDRGKVVPVRSGEKEREITLELAMATLGVQPGEILEFYVEAQDRNPELTGIGLSEVTRLRIISEEEHAKMLRRRIAAEGLGQRYAQAAAAMRDLLATAEALRKALKDGDEARAAELHAQLRKQTEEAREQFGKLADEAVAYDIENGLRDALKDRIGDLKVLEHWLGKMGPKDERLPQTLDEMVQRLQPGTQELTKKAQEAENVASIAAVMRRAGEFQKLLQRQRFLVRRLRRTSNAEPIMLTLGAEQDRIREALAGFQQRLRAAAGNLPPELDELKATALAFATDVDTRRIGETMAEAATASREPDVVTARKKATVALAAMEAMLKQPCKGGEGFAGLCQGEMRFTVPDPLAATCNQIMGALGLGTGTGTGQGVGGGSGDPGDGFRAGGYGTGRGIPVFGKPRSSASAATGPARAGGTGQKGGKGRGGRNDTAPPAHEARGGEEKGTEESRSRAPAGVHPRYREALRRYYEVNRP